MHPYLTEQLVHERIAELHRSAPRRPTGSRSTGSRSIPRARPGRERVGWLLVTLGLRLVGDGRRMPAHGVG